MRLWTPAALWLIIANYRIVFSVQPSASAAIPIVYISASRMVSLNCCFLLLAAAGAFRLGSKQLVMSAGEVGVSEGLGEGAMLLASGKGQHQSTKPKACDQDAASAEFMKLYGEGIVEKLRERNVFSELVPVWERATAECLRGRPIIILLHKETFPGYNVASSGAQADPDMRHRQWRLIAEFEMLMGAAGLANANSAAPGYGEPKKLPIYARGADSSLDAAIKQFLRESILPLQRALHQQHQKTQKMVMELESRKEELLQKMLAWFQSFEHGKRSLRIDDSARLNEIQLKQVIEVLDSEGVSATLQSVLGQLEQPAKRRAKSPQTQAKAFHSSTSFANTSTSIPTSTTASTATSSSLELAST